MTNVSTLQPLQYLCTVCNDTRNLFVNSKVHLNRRELKINGLASYIDIHFDPLGRNKHGAELSIDGNFHVRGFSIMQVKEPAKKSLVPSPITKKTQKTISSSWRSWNSLNLNLKTKGLELKLITENKVDNKLEKNISISSELGTVICDLIIDLNPTSVGKIDHIKEWISTFINFIESASSLWIDNLSNLLLFIDKYAYRRINQVDVPFMKAMLDDSAIIKPHELTIKVMTRYVKTMDLRGSSKEILQIIVDYLAQFDEIPLIRAFNEINIRVKNEFKDETNLLEYYYQLFLHDSIDYFLSYLEIS